MAATPLPDDEFSTATASLFGLTVEEFFDPADAQPLPRVAITSAFAIRSRCTPFPREIPPFSARAWPDADALFDPGRSGEAEGAVRHPHPGVRRVAATHPLLPADLQHELVEDDYREVRASLAANPGLAAPVRSRLEEDRVAAVRSIVRFAEDAEARRDRCVECAEPIKSFEFCSCSVACSIEQYERRVASGFWCDAIAVDYRHRTGLRADWPVEFRWHVAAKVKSCSGIPGMGPVKRQVLASFVRGLPASAIVEFAAQVRDAGMDQARALDLLATTAMTRTGTAAIAAAAGMQDGAWR